MDLRLRRRRVQDSPHPVQQLLWKIPDFPQKPFESRNSYQYSGTEASVARSKSHFFCDANR
jgi:hypothetical protein